MSKTVGTLGYNIVGLENTHFQTLTLQLPWKHFNMQSLNSLLYSCFRTVPVAHLVKKIKNGENASLNHFSFMQKPLQKPWWLFFVKIFPVQLLLFWLWIFKIHYSNLLRMHKTKHENNKTKKQTNKQTKKKENQCCHYLLHVMFP